MLSRNTPHPLFPLKKRYLQSLEALLEADSDSCEFKTKKSRPYSAKPKKQPVNNTGNITANLNLNINGNINSNINSHQRPYSAGRPGSAGPSGLSYSLGASSRPQSAGPRRVKKKRLMSAKRTSSNGHGGKDKRPRPPGRPKTTRRSRG